MNRRHIPAIALSLLAAACDRSSTASSTPRARQDPASDSAAAPHSRTARSASSPSPSPTPPPSSPAAPSGPDSVSTPATGRGSRAAAPDSAMLLQIATQPKSRTIKDSISLVASIRTGLKNPGWPVKAPPLLPGSILPAARIVAYYGNPLSKRMGILGEIPYAQMLAKLDSTVAQWRTADPDKPVVPALHLIVSVAQGLPGKDGMYRQRSDL